MIKFIPNFWCLLDFKGNYRSWSFLPWQDGQLQPWQHLSHMVWELDSCLQLCIAKALVWTDIKICFTSFLGEIAENTVSNLWFNPIHFLLESWWWWLSVFKGRNPLENSKSGRTYLQLLLTPKKIMRIKIECHISCSIMIILNLTCQLFIETKMEKIHNCPSKIYKE